MLENLNIETRYERARHFYKAVWTENLSSNDVIYPFWIGDSDCFWYMHTVRGGETNPAKFSHEYRLVDAQTGINKSAFDHEKLAKVLATASGEAVNSNRLPITNAELEFGDVKHNRVTIIRFTAFNKRWHYDIATGSCDGSDILTFGWEISPDGQSAVFYKENNLWLMDLKSGEERALTNDGDEHCFYANAAQPWMAEARFPYTQARWSPDGKKVLTVQVDQREVKGLPILHHVPDEGLRPVVEYPKMAFPGDEHIIVQHILSIDVLTGDIQRADYAPVQAIRNGEGLFTSNLAWWSSDNRTAYFVDVERGHQTAHLLAFDTESGKTKTLFSETTDSQISFSVNNDEAPSIVPLPETEEVLWWSERSGWGHYYLYCTKTGKLKTTVTSGDWVVRKAIRVDQARREVFLQTLGRTAGIDPYYRDLIRVGLDTGEVTEVVASDHDLVAAVSNEAYFQYNFLGHPHDLRLCNGISPTGNFAVLTQARADEVTKHYLVDRDGKRILDLGEQKLSNLPDSWQWPEPVQIKAADDKTDLYGVVYRPSDFDQNRSYPVLVLVSGAPDLPSVSKGVFGSGFYGGILNAYAHSYAELGFIVISMDPRGTPYRSKAFLNEGYGCTDNVCITDDIAQGVRQLCERFPYMDLKRVGATSPGGGIGVIQLLLRHPDLFRVGVHNCPHDARLMAAQMHGEKFEGMETPDPSLQYPEDYAEKLEGKILFVCGLLDAQTPAAISFRIIEALRKANKDFDMLMLPCFDHDGMGQPYVIRRIWDYLVTHLAGETPPKEFNLEEKSKKVDRHL